MAKDSNGCPDPINDRQTNTMDESKPTEYHMDNRAKLEPEENQRNGIVAVPSKDMGGIDEKMNELIHCGTFKLDSGHKLQYACTFFLAFFKPKSNPPNDS